MTTRKGKPQRDTPFVQDVIRQMEDLPRETLAAVVAEIARGIPYSQQGTFLALLKAPPPIRPDPAALLSDDLTTFRREVATGVYRTTGYGGAWKRRPWYTTLDALLARATDIWESGHKAEGTQAWIEGLSILGLPWYALNEVQPPAGRLKTNLQRILGHLARDALVLPPGERCTRIIEPLRNVAAGGGPWMSLESLLEGELRSLPDAPAFLLEWLQAMEATRTRSDRHWTEHREQYITEAWRLLTSRPDVEAVLRAVAQRDPSAWTIWVQGLVAAGQSARALAVVREGLLVTRAPEHRFALALAMAGLGRTTGDAAARTDALRELWRADPTIPRLLDLLTQPCITDALRDSMVTDELEACEQERYTLSAALLALLELLAGDYDTPLVRAESYEDHPWVHPDSPVHVVQPVLLLLASGRTDLPARSALKDLWSFDLLDAAGSRSVADLQYDAGSPWEDPTPTVAGVRGRNRITRCLRDLLLSAIKRRPATVEQRRRMLGKCETLTLDCVGHSLQEHLRSTYPLAACLVAAVSEVHTLTGHPDRGQAFVQAVIRAHPRHSVFLRTLHQRLSG